MTLAEILEKNPDKRDRDLEQEKMMYFRISERLTNILPETYDVQEVADYVFMPEGGCSANKEYAEKQAIERLEQLNNSKRRFLSKKEVKSVINTGLILGLLGILKDLIVQLGNNIFIGIFIVITLAISLICFDIWSNE